MFYNNLAVASFIVFQLLVYLPIKFLIDVIIMSLRNSESSSDDEVFCGHLSLKELKHMYISPQNKRQTIGANEHPEEDNHNTSLKLISTHSAPNITSNQHCITSPDIIQKALSNTTLSPDEPNLFANANCDVTPSDSFLILEKSCDATTKEFDNTVEEIEYILKNSPSDKKITATNDCSVAESKGDLEINKQGNVGNLALNTKPSAMVTPIKEGQKEKDVFATPISVVCTKPNTLSPDEPNLFANWDVTPSDSFLMLEKSCDASTKEFDNTVEEIKYILKNSPSDKKITATNDCRVAESKGDLEINKQGNVGKLALNTKPSAMVTPIKEGQKEKDVFATPISVVCTKPNIIYRTPANPPSFKKPSTSSLKKTPIKNNAFQHVASPVAYYINNSPQIPPIQNVHPKKISSIPKLIKSSAVKPSNKENVNLPSVAYKSAKKTTVIDVSNGPKMPQSQWAKKLTKSLPAPAVIKHTHREKELFNKPPLRKQEDSFGNLSLHQADVSICTKKAAF